MRYPKLKGKIIEVCHTQGAFAAQLGLSERSVSLKLAGKRDWTRGEMASVCFVLGIPKSEIHHYFF